MLTVNISGVNLDKFIKSESKLQSLKNITRVSHTQVKFDIKGIKLKKFIARCDKMCYTYKVEGYTGIDKIVHYAKCHAGIFPAIIALIIFFAVIKSYVLKIDIYGNDTIKSRDIYAVLNDNGIGIWQPHKADYNDIERTLKQSFDAISQVSVAGKGQYLIINIKEKLPEKQYVYDGDIVADCDGIIKSINVISGTKQKSEGEPFKKGDVIVKGEFVSMQGEVQRCKAVADIIYIEYKSIYTEFNNYSLEKTRTGKSYQKNYLEIWNTGVSDYKSKYKISETIEETRYIFHNNFLPFKLKTLTFYELELTEVKKDFKTEEAKIITQNEELLKNEYLDKNILNISSETIKTENGYIVVSTIQILNTM